jgi:hypothetical protein
LITAVLALVESPFRNKVVLFVTTSWATKTFFPSHAKEVFLAGFLIVKVLLKVKEASTHLL